MFIREELKKPHNKLLETIQMVKKRMAKKLCVINVIL